MIMTASFGDLLEAGRWRPALDKLAGGVTLVPETGTPPGGGRTQSG
jgi:hypothetical protein